MKQNLKNGLAVRGYDLVEMVDSNRLKKGLQDIFTSLDNAKFLFSSEENKKTFLENSQKYLPEYGGFCSIAMSEGAFVDANPKAFIKQNNKLYLFFSKYFGLIDTRRQWTKNPVDLAILADEQWLILKED